MKLRFSRQTAQHLCLAAAFVLFVRPAYAGLIILGDDFTARTEGTVVSTANIQLLGGKLVNEWDPDTCGFADAILNQRAVANYTVRQITAGGVVNVRFLVNLFLSGMLYTGMPEAPGVVPIVSIGGGFDISSTFEIDGYTIENGPFAARQNLIARTHADGVRVPQADRDPVLAIVDGAAERQDPGRGRNPQQILSLLEILITSRATITPLNGPPTTTVISGGAAIDQAGRLTLIGPNPPDVGLNPGMNFLDFLVATQPSFDLVIVDQPVASLRFETTQHLRLRTDCINCAQVPEPGLLTLLGMGTFGVLGTALRRTRAKRLSR